MALIAYGGREEAAGLELLQTHGAGVGAQEQDEGRQCNVRDEATGLPDQLPSIVCTLCRRQ